MSGRLLDPEALRLAEKALENYIDEVSTCVKNLRANMEDCRDNMDSDDFSAKTENKLSESLDEITRVLVSADELKNAIRTRINEIEQLINDYQQ